MADKKAVLSTQAAVVGALLIDPGICGELFAETRAEDLVTADYRDVYEAARRLFVADRPVDPVTVLDKLGGGTETRKFLAELIEVTPSAVNWREYARLLREQARLYRLQQAGEALMRSQTLDEARGILSQAQQDGSDIGKSNAVSVTDGLVDFLLRMDKPVSYIRFGIGRLDQMLFAALGDFIVVGGRPSAGKTLLSIQMAYVLASDYRVGYFSLETGQAKYFDRFFTQACLLDFDRVKRHQLTEEEHLRIAYDKKKLTRLKIDMIPAGGYSIADIQAETLSRRYQVIFVDYLQLVRTERAGNRTEEVGTVSRALHTLAQKHGVLVIALSQLSRPDKTRGGDLVAPTLADLRESGQIEQDADVVLLLYKLNNDPNSDRRLKVAKNKEGIVDAIDLAFDGRRQQLLEHMRIPKAGKPVSATPVLGRPVQDSKTPEDRQLSMEGQT